MTSFLTSLIIASNFLQMPVGEVADQGLYPVPTTIEVKANDTETIQNSNEWAVVKHRLATASRPYQKAVTAQPEVSARSAIVIDIDTQAILWQKNPDSRIPLASITKLATALTWSELYEGKLTKKHAFTQADKNTEPASKDLLLPVGEKMTVEDLLAATLVASYNDAAQALAATTQVSEGEFVDQMNRTARTLGMNHTTFADTTGLSEENTSSAHDAALLVAAIASEPDLQALLTQPEHKITVLGENRDIYVQNTDELLTDPEIQLLAGKTGYTEEAGYCFTAVAIDPTTQKRIAIAVLGTPSADARFTDTKKLINWTFNNYTWY